jgi:hypothetical protein
VIDDEYEGKKKSVVSAFFPMADLNNGEEGERADETEEAGDEEGESAEEGGESDEELFE